MEKIKNIFTIIKNACVIAVFRIYNAHMFSISDFEMAGECFGEKLQECVGEAIDVAGQYYPKEYKHRLREAIRRGFNR
jgi:hypothetical protein